MKKYFPCIWSQEISITFWSLLPYKAQQFQKVNSIWIYLNTWQVLSQIVFVKLIWTPVCSSIYEYSKRWVFCALVLCLWDCSLKHEYGEYMLLLLSVLAGQQRTFKAFIINRSLLWRNNYCIGRSLSSPEGLRCGCSSTVLPQIGTGSDFLPELSCLEVRAKHQQQQICLHAHSIWQFRLEISTSCLPSYLS